MNDDQDWKDDWYNDPKTFPDFSKTRAMRAEGRIHGDEWVAIGLAMPELGDYQTPEEALMQRYAADVAQRAIAIDRERRTKALEDELDTLWIEMRRRLLDRTVSLAVPKMKLDLEQTATDDTLRTVVLQRARSIITHCQMTQEIRGTGARRMKVLRLTLEGLNQREIAHEIGRSGDVDTVKNDRRWLKEHGLLP